MSKWYATFAMTVLPLNSVINPLVYDKALGDFVTNKFKVLRRSFEFAASSRVTTITNLSMTENTGLGQSHDITEVRVVEQNQYQNDHDNNVKRNDDFNDNLNCNINENFDGDINVNFDVTKI